MMQGINDPRQDERVKAHVIPRGGEANHAIIPDHQPTRQYVCQSESTATAVRRQAANR